MITHQQLTTLQRRYDYTTAIAKLLRKKQPTITEQLQELQEAKLVKPVKRGQAQRYQVNWSILSNEFEDFIIEILEGRKEEYDSGVLLSRVKKAGIKRVVPHELFASFLREYFDTLTNLGGLAKDFYDVSLSFFKALSDLDKRRWQKLVKKYGIDGELLSELSSSVSLEISVLELTALQTFIDVPLSSDNAM